METRDGNTACPSTPPSQYATTRNSTQASPWPSPGGRGRPPRAGLSVNRAVSAAADSCVPPIGWPRHRRLANPLQRFRAHRSLQIPWSASILGCDHGKNLTRQLLTCASRMLRSLRSTALPSPSAPHSTDQPGKELDTFKRRLAILQLLKRGQGRSVRELQSNSTAKGLLPANATCRATCR